MFERIETSQRMSPMAPRKLNDDAVLFQIALCFLDDPDASFVCVERRATAIVQTHKHSDDSRRKRLQRKFTADQVRWMRKARSHRAKQQAERQAQQIRALHETLTEAGRAAAQALNNIRDAIGPRVALAAEYLSRPDVQENLRNVSRALQQMQRQKTITITK